MAFLSGNGIVPVNSWKQTQPKDQMSTAFV
jgi:hypothetical protein